MVLLIALALTPVLPTAAQEAPRIVGGSEARRGAWPSQVALLDAHDPNDLTAQRCGGTVVSPSWVLTAAHCLFDLEGALAPGDVDVLTGRADLEGTGGQRLDVAQIVLHPIGDGLFHDVALLRLDQATNARPVALVQPGDEALWEPGASLTATGWGRTDPTDDQPSPTLRQVDLRRVTDDDCAAVYPPDPGRPQFDERLNLCAGWPDADGRGVCQGDSGGPLMAQRPNGGWVQVGVTSYGAVCGEAEIPALFARLANYTPWISQTTRFGPFAPATEFVDHQYLDILGRPPTPAERDDLLARLDADLAPEQAIADLVTSDPSNLSVGAIVRFYYGYFDGRDPDPDGLPYWAEQHRSGVSLATIAAAFSESGEFRETYGDLTDGEFVDLVYENVLHREPEAGGRAYWIGQLGDGLPRWTLMSLFTESEEHRTVTRTRVDRTVAYTAMVRRSPPPVWLDLVDTVALPDITRALLHGLTYAERF